MRSAHPGVVQVFDFGTLPTGAPYLVMELLEGESLAALLARSGKLAVTDAIEITCQAANPPLRQRAALLGGGGGGEQSSVRRPAGGKP